MPALFFHLCLFFLLILFGGCQSRQPALSHKVPPHCDYYSLKSAQCLTQQKLLEKLSPYKVIFIGDHHSEDNLHLKIAHLITSLSQQGFKIHLAHEWFSPGDADTLDSFIAEDINETEFLERIQWKKRLKFYPYESFKPMYEAVKANKGVLHGINLSKAERTRLSDQNLSAMSEDELAFANSLDLNVTPHQQFVMPYLSHCHAPKKNETLEACTQRMYRVQVAWDSKMAEESYHIAQGLSSDEKLLVFAGSMHIENGLGIPLRFARLSDLPTLSIIPEESQRNDVDNGLGDYLLFYKEKGMNK